MQVVQLLLLAAGRSLGIVVVDGAGQCAADSDGALDRSVGVDVEERPGVGDLPVDVQRPDLGEVGDAEQRVADEHLVVDEAERLFRVERHQPERQLAHLDGHRVDVGAVQALGDDLAQGVGRLLLRRPDAGAGGCPGFDEACGQVAGGGDEESA